MKIPIVKPWLVTYRRNSDNRIVAVHAVNAPTRILALLQAPTVFGDWSRTCRRAK